MEHPVWLENCEVSVTMHEISPAWVLGSSCAVSKAERSNDAAKRAPDGHAMANTPAIHWLAMKICRQSPAA